MEPHAIHTHDSFFSTHEYVSPAGTNFLVRSHAFEEVGWSPTYTLTEDYALGMELTMNKWKCRYVERYLATGEAPEQLRNCFQQRSRWCKVLLDYLIQNSCWDMFSLSFIYYLFDTHLANSYCFKNDGAKAERLQALARIFIISWPVSWQVHSS